MDISGIQQPSKEEVVTCANSINGQQFLHDIGVQTLALQPELYFVPWVTFNGVSKHISLQLHV